MKKIWRAGILYFALASLLGPVSAQAAEYPTGTARVFMDAETQNSYVPNSTVNETFKPGSGKTFPIKYLEIPAQDLHLVDSTAASPDMRRHFIVQKNGQTYVRFFIHPDSEHLYQPIMKRYGIAGSYMAAATASTRSLLAWPKGKPQELIFLKLSLAQIQDRLGRIIPGWEVRRSVGVSETAMQTPDEVWKYSGASIITEFAGAYVDAAEKLPFFVDEKQGNVLEHGLIARDATFLKEFPGDTIIPLFALFSQGAGGSEPLIIKLWKARQAQGKISFVDFVSEYLFKPFLDKNAYMLFRQGIVPEFHGQNVVVVLDRQTSAIKHFYHRDVGSMKVDLRLRWTQGLGVQALRSKNALFDFKFARAPTSIADNLKNYLNDWIFRWGYLDVLKKHVPDFNPDVTREILLKMALVKVREELPLRTRKVSATIADHLAAFYAENLPQDLQLLSPADFDSALVEKFIAAQTTNEQILELPREWSARFAQLPAVTEYGVVFRNAQGALALALHDSANLEQIRSTASAYKKTPLSNGRRIGILSGTFDPPHLGHAEMLKNAMTQLKRDGVIVVPNHSPVHKPNALAFAKRAQMARAAFAQNPGEIVADETAAREFQEQGVRAWSAKTVATAPDIRLFQIMGDDSMDRWMNRPTGYPANVSLAVASRSSKPYSGPLMVGTTPVELVTISSVGLSSTKIRGLIEQGSPVGPDLLHPTVEEIIRREGPYKKVTPQRCEDSLHGLFSRIGFGKAG